MFEISLQPKQPNLIPTATNALALDLDETLINQNPSFAKSDNSFIFL